MEQKTKIDNIYKLTLMENYDQIYQKKLLDRYNKILDISNKTSHNKTSKNIETIILQSKLNVRLIELEPLVRINCDQMRRYSEFQIGYFTDEEYKQKLSEFNQLVFCSFKFVIGINDFKIRVEMSAVIDSEGGDYISLIDNGNFNGNIKIYFNDIKIDTRELQGNSGPSEDMIYNHFSHIFNDKDYFLEVYLFIIFTYMEAILK